MSELSDGDLLRDLAAGNRDAMSQVVARYLDFVYACALRQVRDPSLADDVTQAVFVILWTKARTISPEVFLHAWLFNTTRFSCANAVRMRARRTRREREAADMHTRQATSAKSLEVISPMLDGALAALREKDRAAVLMSFFAGKSWNEVGLAMGVSAEAARKRGDRAIDKLRDYFARRGVAMTGASLALAGQASAAPASLAQHIGTSCAVASLASAASTSPSMGIAKGAIQMMTWAKLKLAGAITAALLVTVAVAGAVALRHEPAPPPAQAIESPEPFVATLPGNVAVKVFALSQRDGNDRAYWSADGSPTSIRFDDSDSVDNPPHTHQLLFTIDGLEVGDGCTWRFSNSPNWSAVPALLDGVSIDDAAQVVTLRPTDGAKTTDLKVAVARGPYRSVAIKRELDAWQHERDDRGEVILSACTSVAGQTSLFYTEHFENCQRRIVAFDQNGNEHLPTERASQQSIRINLQTVQFELPVEEIDRIEFQVRPFDQSVTIKDISLVPGNRTRPAAVAGPATLPAPSGGR